MDILFLSQRVPYPPDRGDKITTSRLVERMRRRHDVTCLAFAHGPDDLRWAQELTDRGIPTVAVPYHPRRALLKSLPLLLGRTPLTLGVYGSRHLQREVDRRIATADLAYAFSSSMGAFLLPHAHVPRVMHFAELDSDKWRQYASHTARPARWVYSREWRTLLEFERTLAYCFDENVVCTTAEQRFFQEQIPGASCAVLQNGVDVDYFNQAGADPDPGHIVFTGVMNYFPNVDACAFFVREVLPRVRKRVPEAHFTIVGAHPTREVLRLERERGVRVTGFVPDTREYLRRAAVAVAPLRIARGIQNKALEAMAMGLPVVGTPAATQGIGGMPGEHYLVAESADAQAEAVCRILGNLQDARELGQRARRFVEQNYRWEDCLAQLDRILEHCTSKPGRREASLV